MNTLPPRKAQENNHSMQPDVIMTIEPVIYEDNFRKGIPSNESQGLESFQPYIRNYPTVYILYSETETKNEAYVGETTHLKDRIYSHANNSDRDKLNRMVAIGCETFNQSATYNVESNLISCMLADGLFKLQNKSQISDSFTIHNYYQKSYYNEELFGLIWEELIATGLAQSSLLDIQNRDIYKLSPYKQLSNSQYDLVKKVTEFCDKHVKDSSKSVFLIKGEAGTGKSVVLSSLYKKLVDMSGDSNTNIEKDTCYLLVNHSEQLKTCEKIARGIKGLQVNKILKPTTFINKAKQGRMEPGITIVDEAHLLLSHSDSYNGFKEENHLEEIIRNSKITIVVYDEKQVLKLKSHWNKSRLEDILAQIDTVEEIELKEQFRMLADEGTIHWIDSFVEEQRVLTPEHLQFGKDTQGFELLFFDDAEKMYEEIKKKNAEDSLSRIVATFDYEHKKDGAEYYVEEGAFKLPWNITNDKEDKKATWAERDKTIDEVGSIYTVQGFDLNYVGVILGPSVVYDEETERIVILPENYKDTEAFRSRKDIPAEEVPRIKEQIILNSINILFKRGMKGLYIYAHDPALRKKLVSLA